MRLELFNEVTAIFLINILPIFSDYNLIGSDAVIEADILFLFVLSTNLTVHLFFLIKGSIIDCKRKCRKRCNKAKAKKKKKQEERRMTAYIVDIEK